MTSILTNTAAMTSLQALATTQRSLATTQAQVSSGRAVSTASDNAAYWTIGQQMSAQISGLNAVNQGLALTGSIADVTTAALAAIKGSLDKIHNDVVAAQQAGIDKSALQSDISAQQQSILAIANAASFNGVNWLVNTLSRSLVTEQTITITTPRPEFDALLLGQDPGGQSDFRSTQVSTTTVVENGMSASQTVTSAYHVATTDAQDGTPATTRDPQISTTVGSTDFSTFATVSLPMSEGTSGLLSSSLSLAPLALFTDFTGTTTFQRTVTAGGAPDPGDSFGPGVSTGTSQSYDGSGGGAALGILDPIVLTTDGSGSPPSPSNPPIDPTQEDVELNIDGGTVYTLTPSDGGGGSEPTAQTVQESILDLNIVGTSADDLTVIQQAVETAIGGIVNAATVVGALRTEVSTQQAYNSALADNLTSGLGSLVDADMNVASTRLQALQTQQQLGIQALSIANENSQLVLKLFGQA